MAGLTAAGLEIKTLGDVREDLNAKWREAFGQSMDVSDNSPDGQLLGIAAEPPALLWEVLEAIVSSRDPDKATKAALDAVCSETGTTRRPATFSVVTLTLTGTPTALITGGSLVSTTSTGQQFTTTEDATIAAATAWAGSTAYLVADRSTNSSGIYLCITAGTSAASGGPTGTDPDVVITDGTAEWRFLGAGTGFVDVVARGKEPGPIVAVARDIRSIDTPLGGWSGAINILDAATGRNQMTDAELRVLRRQELAKPGTGPRDAIRAALLEVGKDTLNPVTAATVFHNVTDVTDADGVPPHSVEALVTGGEDQDIFDALRLNVVGGIRTHGTVVGTSVDSSGVAQDEKFSRTTGVDIFVGVTLVKDAALYPDDGDAQVKLAIVTFGNAQDDGRDAVSSALLAQVFSVPGVIQADLPLIGTAFPPVASTTVAISLRQRAVYDTTRVTVASSSGVP